MVRVVSCFITALSNIDTLRLHLNPRDFIFSHDFFIADVHGLLRFMSMLDTCAYLLQF